MPAGAGPQVAQVTAFVMPADTAEHIVATVTGSWNAVLGTFLSFSALFTGAAAGTVTFRMRQTAALTGTQVGPNIPITTSIGGINLPGLEVQDQTAYALNQQGGSYVLTAQGSAVSLGTITTAALALETVSPVS